MYLETTHYCVLLLFDYLKSQKLLSVNCLIGWLISSVHVHMLWLVIVVPATWSVQTFIISVTLSQLLTITDNAYFDSPLSCRGNQTCDVSSTGCHSPHWTSTIQISGCNSSSFGLTIVFIKLWLAALFLFPTLALQIRSRNRFWLAPLLCLD